MPARRLARQQGREHAATGVDLGVGDGCCCVCLRDVGLEHHAQVAAVGGANLDGARCGSDVSLSWPCWTAKLRHQQRYVASRPHLLTASK